MKKIILASVLYITATCASAQVYMTRTGFAQFYSKTSLEDIQATNQQLLAVINTDKKELAFMVLLKGFEFKKDLMQTHFNENYVESDKYPKASFNGTYVGDVDMKNGAVSNVVAKGAFTLHGVTKQIEIPATLQFTNGTLIGHAVFNVTPEDYNITIPLLVRNKIAKQTTVEIKVNCTPKN
jgi:polyisoprenoid-binding protein YceI